MFAVVVDAFAVVVDVFAAVVDVFAAVVDVFAVVVDVFAAVVDVFVVVGVLVTVVVTGVQAQCGVGFIGADDAPTDRRARPSSDSTEIDAFLLCRRWFCSWCGFIGFFS